jgi:PAS domain S-box-containing protein
MNRGSLYQRLLAVVLLSVVPVFLVHIAVQIASDLSAARARAEGNTQDIAAATIPLLQNLLIVGDLATAQEVLDNIMRHGQFRHLSLLDEATARPLATGQRSDRVASAAVPPWLSSWLDFRFPSQRFVVQAGGVTYATLVVEPSTEVLVADIWQRLWTAAVLWLATAACLLLLLQITLRRGLRPLAALAEAANRFGSGDLTCRAPSCEVPELAATAMAFNRMAENLADAQETLEIRVRDRTAELAAREAHTSAILRNLHDGVIQVDAQRRILMANAAACRLFGYREGELVGRNLAQLMPAAIGSDWSGAAIDAVDGAAGGGRSRRLEMWGRRKDGTGFDVEIARDRLSLAGGDTCIAVLRNISEQKAIEAEREAARQSAEELARAKSEFLANMSHEIRTPLNAILGLAQVGQRKHGDPEVQAMLGRILQSGELLLRVINDILDFSKIEAQRLRIESIPFRLADVVDHAVAIVAPSAYGKGLEFLVAESSDLPVECRGDPVRIAQILMNLLSNAIKFTESGQVCLDVTRRDGLVCFRIRDTGIGMEPDVLQRLFRPFEQADASISRRFGGTGLGLAISRRLASLMGGEIRVTSLPERGTTIEVLLPLGGEPRVCSPLPDALTFGLAGLPPDEAALLDAALRNHGCEPVDLLAESPVRRAGRLVAVVDERFAAKHPDRLTRLSGPETQLVIVHSAGAKIDLPAELEVVVRRLERPLRWRQLVDCCRQVQLPARSASAPVKRRLQGLRVLAAEDDAANRLVLREILEMEGAAVEIFEHGTAACERLREVGPDAFDLAITDLQMPWLDGYATARAIARLAPGLPVVGISAHTMPEEQEQCRAAGMVALLPKPVAVDALVNLLVQSRDQVAAVPGAATPAVAEAASPGSIDWQALEQRFGGNAAFVNELAASFLESARQTSAELAQALSRRDFEALAALGHRMAGMAANLLQDSLAAHAREAEQLAKVATPRALPKMEFLLASLEAVIASLGFRLTGQQQAPVPAHVPQAAGPVSAP